LEQNFKNFTVRGRYLKAQKIIQNFKVLRLQEAVITPQWLQIDGHLPPKDACLVFMFTIRINSKSFRWAVRSIQESYFHIFGTVQRPCRWAWPDYVIRSQPFNEI